jgi:hypothetical protein
VKIKVSRELSTPEGGYLRMVDFVSDHVDLVVNPHYKTYDSTSVRRELRRCGVEGPCDLIDGDVLHSGIQYVTVAFCNPEDFTKVRLLMDETTTEKRYGLEDIL